MTFCFFKITKFKNKEQKMDEYSGYESNENKGIHRVRDPLEIIGNIGGVCLGGFLVFISLPHDGKEMSLFWAVIGGLIFVSYILTTRAIWNGVEIDYDNGTLSFPGGGISANSIFNYINPVFIFQSFFRKKIRISDIKSINTSYKSNISKEGKVSYTYLISIIGKFGGVTLTYNDENKRDELFSLIREINRMGIPFMRS